MTEERRRPTRPAEWVTFGVAAAIVLGVIVTILVLARQSTTPPAPAVAVGEVTERDDRYFVPVVVENRGDETAQNVQVTATLTLDDGEVTSDQVVDFLAGGDSAEVEFVFEDDPEDGELEVVIGGFGLP